MRQFILDNFNTWDDWRLTLTAKATPPPEVKANYINLDGRHGSLDLSEALTGEVVYGDRTVEATFWTSEGTDTSRVQLIREIIAALHGKKVRIVEPDDPDHYFLGRVSIKPVAHDLVHDEFDMAAICEPWRYACEETVRWIELTDSPADVVIRNHGVKTLCPDIEVDGSVLLTYDGGTVELTTGSHKVTGFKLRQGCSIVSVSGSGSVTFVYREATL